MGSQTKRKLRRNVLSIICNIVVLLMLFTLG